jgi:putative membrane protein
VALICASLLLGIINAMIRPVLLLLSLPFIVVTLGFFILIVNALMLKLVGVLVWGFHVEGFWSAFFGSILIGIVSWALNGFIRGEDGRVHVITRQTQIKQARGRVIDI